MPLDILMLDMQPEGYAILLIIIHLVICMAGFSE